MARQKYLYTWRRGSCDVNVIIVSCGSKKIKIFLPENACYVA